jgi:hypothetical protein
MLVMVVLTQNVSGGGVDRGCQWWVIMMIMKIMSMVMANVKIIVSMVMMLAPYFKYSVSLTPLGTKQPPSLLCSQPSTSEK